MHSSTFRYAPIRFDGDAVEEVAKKTSVRLLAMWKRPSDRLGALATMPQELAPIKIDGIRAMGAT